MTPEAIKHMVDRFLQWKLPENFNPDGGISFAPIGNAGTLNAYWRLPVGTNLFDAGQAEAMVRFMVEGLPEVSALLAEVARLKAELAEAEQKIEDLQVMLHTSEDREATARAEERDWLAKWHTDQAAIAEKNMNASAFSDETEGWRRAMWAHRQSAAAIAANVPPDWNKTQRPDGTWAADDTKEAGR
jgi:hypothetical protein